MSSAPTQSSSVREAFGVRAGSIPAQLLFRGNSQIADSTNMIVTQQNPTVRISSRS